MDVAADSYANEPSTRIAHRWECKNIHDLRKSSGLANLALGENHLPASVNPLDPLARARILQSTNAYLNQYPRIFQAWNKADNLTGEDPISTMARHDLFFTTPEALGLQTTDKYPGLAPGFTEESVAAGLELRKQLLQKNPRMLILASIQYRDAYPDYFPPDSLFWQRDAQGTPVTGWKDTASTKACWKIDFTKPEVQDLIAVKCLAAIKSGVVDGIMLDWWNDGESDGTHNQERLNLLKKVRAAVGPDCLILVNSNDIRADADSPSARLLKQSAPLVNGVFMESVQSLVSSTGKGTYTNGDWNNIEKALQWNEENMRPPRINCVETWFQSSRDDERLMRATTTLALTRSNAYALFSDPNRLPVPDHLHNWYHFWNKTLGKPLEAPGKMRKDGSSVREFENGTVVYNSILNHGPVTITFSDQRIPASQAESQPKPPGTVFTIQPSDGELFLKAR